MLEAALLVLEFVVHVRYQFQLLEQDTIENVSYPIKNQKRISFDLEEKKIEKKLTSFNASF